MAGQGRESTPPSAAAAPAKDTPASGGDRRQNQLGNAEVQARMSGAGGGSGSAQSGAEGGPAGSGTGWSPAVQTALSKLPMEAQTELGEAWAKYVAHVRANVAKGWHQGWTGDLAMAASSRGEWHTGWQELGPIKYPYPSRQLRDPKPGDPMGVCYDWQHDVAEFINGLGLVWWHGVELSRSNPDHGAGAARSKDGSVTVVFDGWANWTDRGQAQTEAEWEGG